MSTQHEQAKTRAEAESSPRTRKRPRRPDDGRVEAISRGCTVALPPDKAPETDTFSVPYQSRAPPTERERIADDLLIGAKQIAEELGVPPYAVYHLARLRRLPIGKLGRNLIASRAKLRRAALALAS